MYLLKSQQYTDFFNWLKAAKLLYPEQNFSWLASLVNQLPTTDHPQLVTHSCLILHHLLALTDDPLTLSCGMLYPFYQAKCLNTDAAALETKQLILLSHVQKMEAIGRTTQQHTQAKAEQLQKMLLAMLNDTRVIFIKLAERIAALSLLKTADKHIQTSTAEHAMRIYAPLANRLGIGQMKWVLEDLAFRYLSPEEYHDISHVINMKREGRDKLITHMKAKLRQVMHEANINPINITGRAKHIYSIYKKLARKNTTMSNLYDISAMRVIVDDIKACYIALSAVHAKWEHIPVEFDDYIANPKPNGYRSIHTAVKTSDGIIIEIQIRTTAMHEEAERGIAAHWAYKEADKQQSKKQYLSHLLDWQKDIEPSNTSTASRIYIFTPANDIIDLPQNATPIDCAYHIHTNIGHRISGAKVNSRLVPLTQTLKTGDHIEILTRKTATPSRDWLNPRLRYIASKRAHQKITLWFRKLYHQEHIQLGMQAFEKAVRQHHLDRARLKLAPNYFHLNSVDDVLAAVGSNDISILSLRFFLENKSPAPIKEKNPKPHKPSPHKQDIIIAEESGLITERAQCCTPDRNHNIVAYTTVSRGIIIHQANCPNVTAQGKRHPERLLSACWS